MTRDQQSKQRGPQDVLDLPAYTIRETAHHLRLPVTTVRDWLLGRTYPTTEGKRRALPVIKPFYRASVPSFGEWGFVLGALRSLSPTRARLTPGVETRYLTTDLLPSMFRFPKDIAHRKTPINRLDNQVLVRLYEKGFKRYNQ